MKQHLERRWFLLIVAAILALSAAVGLLGRFHLARTNVYFEGKSFPFSLPEQYIRVELADHDHQFTPEETQSLLSAFQGMTLSPVSQKEAGAALNADYPGVSRIPFVFLTAEGQQVEYLLVQSYLRLDNGRWYEMDPAHRQAIDTLLAELGLGC